MRKQHDGLAGATSSLLGADPMSGQLFVFFNRRRNRLKLFWWDRGGFALLYKRLERGRFRFPEALDGGKQVKVDAGELALILEGIDLRGATWRARWNPIESQAFG